MGVPTPFDRLKLLEQTFKNDGAYGRTMRDDDLVPFPFNCPKCAKPMQFQHARMESDRLEPYRIQIYFCPEHGFFRYSRYHALDEGM